MASGTAEMLSSTLTDPQPFVIAGREFRSRLMVGTGKYASNALMLAAIEASAKGLAARATESARGRIAGFRAAR